MDISGTPPAFSSDVTLRKRILSDAFSLVLQTSPGIFQIISELSADEEGKGYGEYSQTDNRLEWLEGIRSYKSDILNNGGAVAAADTEFTVTNIDRFKVNMLIRWVDNYEVMKVVGVNTSTSKVHVTREHNNETAPTSIADGTQIDIIGKPEVEYQRVNEVGIKGLSVEYNYFQTFRKDLPISEKVMLTKSYGFKDGQAFINWNVQQMMMDVRDDIRRSLIWGERYSGTPGTDTDPPEARGVWRWLKDGGITSNAAGADLSAAMLNDILKTIFKSDSSTNGLSLYMNFEQAQKMAAFNTYVANRTEQVKFRESMAAGQTYVSQFVGDLAAYGVSTIVADKDAPPGAVMILNKNKIKMIPSKTGRMREFDSRTNDMHPDAKRPALVTEYSLKFKDHTTSHGLIYGLKTT